MFDPTASNIDWKEIWIPSALAFYMAALLSVLFTGAGSDRTRGNKLKENRFELDIRKKLFILRVMRHWDRLPREAEDVPSLWVLKTRLDGALSNMV